jgi:hypothetical protein
MNLKMPGLTGHFFMIATSRRHTRGQLKIDNRQRTTY